MLVSIWEKHYIEKKRERDVQFKFDPEALHKSVFWQEKEWPYVLPVNDETNKTCTWYIFFANLEDKLDAQSELRAFVGQSYSYYNGGPFTLSPSITIEHRWLQYDTDLHVIAIKTNLTKWQNVSNNLALWWKLHKKRPSTGTKFHLSFTEHQLLKYENALYEDNIDTCNKILAHLKRNGTLTKQNIIGLEILAYERQQKWAKIVETFKELVLAECPVVVKHAIYRAIYYDVLKIDDPIHAQEIRERFFLFYEPRYQNILAGLRQATFPEALIVFSLYASDTTNIPKKRLHDIELLLEKADPYWMDIYQKLHAQPVIVNPLPPKNIEQQLQDIGGLVFMEKYEDALTQLFSLEISEAVAQMALKIAKHTSNTSHIQQIVTYLELWIYETSVIPETIEKDFDTIIKKIEPQYTIITWAKNWKENPKWNEAKPILLQLLDNLDNFQLSEIDAEAFVQYIDANVSQPIGRDIGIVLASKIVKLPENPDWTPIYTRLFTFFQMNADSLEHFEQNQWYELTRILFTIGKSTTILKEAIEYWGDFTLSVQSRPTLVFGVKMLHLYKEYQGTDILHTEQIFLRLEQICRTYRSNNDIDCLILDCYDLAHFYGIQNITQWNSWYQEIEEKEQKQYDISDEQLIQTFKGPLIGIYILQPSSAENFKTKLQQINKLLQVEINSDKVQTNTLKSLCQRSTLFIEVWSSAAHAATACIDKYFKGTEHEHRRILPPDKSYGTSSLYRCFIQKLRYLHQSNDSTAFFN